MRYSCPFDSESYRQKNNLTVTFNGYQRQLLKYCRTMQKPYKNYAKAIWKLYKTLDQTSTDRTD